VDDCVLTQEAQNELELLAALVSARREAAKTYYTSATIMRL
jgi:hypothetical protein